CSSYSGSAPSVKPSCHHSALRSQSSASSRPSGTRAISADLAIECELDSAMLAARWRDRHYGAAFASNIDAGGTLLTRTRVVRLLIVSLVAVAAAGCGWTQVGFDASNSGLNPVEAALPNAINLQNVAALQPAWTMQVNPNATDHIVSRPIGILG